MLSMFFDGSGEFSGTLKKNWARPKYFRARLRAEHKIFSGRAIFFRAEQKQIRARFRARAPNCSWHAARTFSGIIFGHFSGRSVSEYVFVIFGRADFLMITFLKQTLDTLSMHHFRASLSGTTIGRIFKQKMFLSLLVRLWIPLGGYFDFSVSVSLDPPRASRAPPLRCQA